MLIIILPSLSVVRLPTNLCEELQAFRELPQLFRSRRRKTLIVESLAGEVEVPHVGVGRGDGDGDVAEDDGAGYLFVKWWSRDGLYRALGTILRQSSKRSRSLVRSLTLILKIEYLS